MWNEYVELHFYLTQSVFKVVFQKSTPLQIRQLQHQTVGGGGAGEIGGDEAEPEACSYHDLPRINLI